MGRYLVLILAMVPCLLQARDFGMHGQTYPIAEEDLITVIETRLRGSASATGTILDPEQVAEKARRPKPAGGLKKGTEYRAFLYDPSITVRRDIEDHEGNIIFAAGATVNPLDRVSMPAPILIFDGDDPDHIAWAQSQDRCTIPQNPIWVLVDGCPMELELQEGRPVYFDQAGRLVKKLGIRSVPARVSQQGLTLLVEEVLPRVENSAQILSRVGL